MQATEKRKIKFFDTTLRDGEQTPGVSLNIEEKVKIALQLEKLGMDVIEAGFAAASQGDFKAVNAVAKAVKNPVVTSLARCVEKDIEAAWEAVKDARHPRIHVFIATSPVHMEFKLKMTPEQVYDRAVAMTRYAKRFCEDIEFSPEDGSRSDPKFLYRILEGVIDAGANCLNIPDTVGYSSPEEFSALIRGIFENVPNIGKAEISVHCHNDLGLAVANSLAAIKAGATQIECTINGLGERGGNAAFEEIVMGLRTRPDYYNVSYNTDTTQIVPTSKLVCTLTGVPVQPNKAIVGANAFLHASGIHQHGVLANKSTYEIMTPESVGIVDNNNIVLGKLSGRHAFEQKLSELGFSLDKDGMDSCFAKFKDICDRKKNVTDEDIYSIASEYVISVHGGYEVTEFQIQTGSRGAGMAMITLKHNGDEAVSDTAIGTGSVDAAFNAVNRILKKEILLESYSIRAVTEGTDALGEVDVKVSHEGRIYKGRGVSTDVIEASIRAYVNACNSAIFGYGAMYADTLSDK
ncbi:MAG: 2-isopropylmalate synthase [Eubacteriales bacterium]